MLHQGGFARSGVADDSDELAVGNVQADILQRIGRILRVLSVYVIHVIDNQ
jgi:hypothetical protein